MLALVRQYIVNWLMFLLDQSINTLRGGDPGETLSVAAAKARNQNKAWGCILCKMLGAVLRGDHCTKALNNFGHHSLWGD